MTDQDEKKIEQDERPMTVKKKTQRKNKELDKRPTRKKEEKMHFCASDVETQPRPSQKKVLMNVELGTKRELGMPKKGLGLWPFLFSCSNDVLWAQKRLVSVACGLQWLPLSITNRAKGRNTHVSET